MKRNHALSAMMHEQMRQRQADIDEKHVAYQRRESPYRPVDGCSHWATVERTCDYYPGPFLTPEGRVDCHVIVRLRVFECADCGAGVWPSNDAARANAERRPRCTRPFCDCFDL